MLMEDHVSVTSHGDDDVHGFPGEPRLALSPLAMVDPRYVLPRRELSGMEGNLTGSEISQYTKLIKLDAICTLMPRKDRILRAPWLN